MLSDGLIIKKLFRKAVIFADGAIDLLKAVSFGWSIYENSFLKSAESKPALVQAGLASQDGDQVLYNLPKMLAVFSD